MADFHSIDSGRAGLALSIALCLAVATVGAFAGTGLAADTDSSLEIVESSTASETVTVELRTTAEDVAGYEANLTYDDERLTATDVSGVDLNDPATNDTHAGAIQFTQSQRTGVDDPVLAAVTFDVEADGTTDIEFADRTLVTDGDGDRIDLTLDGATVAGETDDDTGGGGNVAPAQESDDETDDDDADDSSDTESDDTGGAETDDLESDDDGDAVDQTDDVVESNDDDGVPGFGAALTAVVIATLVTLIGRRRIEP